MPGDRRAIRRADRVLSLGPLSTFAPVYGLPFMSVRALTIDRISGGFALAFSLTALLTIVIAYLQPPPPTPPTDEGTLAHIFQLAVVLFVPALLLFVTTADWRRPRASLALVAVCSLALTVAFVGLYMGEHGYWYPLAR